MAFTSPSLLVVMSIRGLENSSIGSIYGDKKNESNKVNKFMARDFVENIEDFSLIMFSEAEKTLYD